MAYVAVDQEIQAFWRKLKELGLGPDEDVRRVIIDIPCNECVKVYYECYADRRMLDIDMTPLLKGAKVIGVSEAAAVEP